MKFLAVLRDSYREAMSTWVIPVMLFFTFVLVLLIASIGFRPVTVQDELESRLGLLNFVRINPAFKNQAPFLIENLKSSNEREPWKADYEFDFVFRASPEGLKQLEGGAGMPLTKQRTKNFLTSQVSFLKNINVTDNTPKEQANPNVVERRFHVTSQGTKIEDRLSWFHEPSIFFSVDLPLTTTLRGGVYRLEKTLVNDIGSIATLLVAVIITAGFIPNLLRKGSVDLYISKPIGRIELLIYKYFGGLLFVLILMTVMVGSVWVTLGLRTGLWSPSFLLLIPVITFYFAILYAVSTLAAVLTRSTLVAILASFLAYAIFFGIGFGFDIIRQVKEADRVLREKLVDPNAELDEIDEPAPAPAGGPPGAPPPKREPRRPTEIPQWLDIGSRVLYYPCPRTSDLDNRMIRVIADGILTDFEIKEKGLTKELPSWGETLGVSTAFIIICLLLSCWIMSRRDN